MQHQAPRTPDQSAAVLRRIVDTAPGGAALVGPDGTVLAWNATAEQLTGWAAEDVVGGPDPTVPEELRDETSAVLQNWLADPDSAGRRITTRLRPDGTPLAMVIDAVVPIDLGDGGGLVVWFSEATDLDALVVHRNRLTRQLAGATRIDEVVPVLTRAVRDVLGAQDAVVLRQCPPAEHLHGVRGLGMETEVAEQVQLALGGDAPWDRAAAGRITDGSLEVDGRAQPASFVPMGPEGEGWVLATTATRAAAASSHVRDLFLAVADEAWAALQRVALVSELDGKIEILEATHRIASSVGLDLDEALRAVSRRAAEALSCERAGVYLVDPETDELALAHVHATDASPDALLADDEGLALAAEVVDTGAEVLYQDVTACEIAAGPWHTDAGSVAVMGLPLQVASRTVGALVVAHTVAHPRGFTTLCQQVGAAVAQQAAIAVEHARLFEAERDHVRHLQDLDRMKADWMAGVTHDLRAPLTGLLGFVETLRRMTGRVSEDEQRRYLTVMARQADQLVNLVEDLLLSARVDAEAVARRREIVHLDRVVDEVVAGLQPEERTRVEVVTDGVDVPVVGDASHLERVVQNLLSNAWRHGGSRARLELAHEDGQVLLAVQDDGPGVPVAERERIFDRFVHGEHEASSGLGLYVVRGIVDAHDGSIVVADRADGRPGARFEVRFPRGRPQREEDVAATSTPAEDRRRADRRVRIAR